MTYFKASYLVRGFRTSLLDHTPYAAVIKSHLITSHGSSILQAIHTPIAWCKYGTVRYAYTGEYAYATTSIITRGFGCWAVHLFVSFSLIHHLALLALMGSGGWRHKRA